MIEISKKLVEAMHRGQKLVAITQMVLAELCGCVTLRFQELRNRWIFRREPFLGCRQPDFQKARAQRTLSGDESSTTGCAGLLPIIVGENCSLVGDAIDVRRAITHHAAVV